jgi:hypothetical protein
MNFLCSEETHLLPWFSDAISTYIITNPTNTQVSIMCCSPQVEYLYTTSTKPIEIPKAKYDNYHLKLQFPLIICPVIHCYSPMLTFLAKVCNTELSIGTSHCHLSLPSSGPVLNRISSYTALSDTSKQQFHWISMQRSTSFWQMSRPATQTILPQEQAPRTVVYCCHLQVLSITTDNSDCCMRE